MTPQPLEALAPRASGVRGLLADIDDTISSEGRITARAYDAMERLQSAGLLMIPITGRPAGWCDHIARMWPVDAVVGENGAFYMRYDHKRRKLTTRHVGDATPSPADIAERQRKLRVIGERIIREVPGAAWASDQPYRIADIAIDFCEDVPRLSQRSIDRISEIMRDEGLTAKVSSIHVNGWFGDYDKLGMTQILMFEEFGMDIAAEQGRKELVFIGDSPNDAPMFGFFPLSVGVANVSAFLGRIEHPPQFIASRHNGDGFVELAELLLSVHRR